jgi:glycosyltransferase involved in cell wall biosynthesis
MRILIIAPTGEIPHTRTIPTALARNKEVELTVVAPKRVKAARIHHSSGWFSLEAEEYFNGYRLIPVPLRAPYDYMSVFESRPLRIVIKNARPAIIQMWTAPGVIRQLLQVLWMKWQVYPKAKIIFYGWDNILFRFGKWSRLKWAVTKLVWYQVAGGLEADSEGVTNIRRAGFRGLVERAFWGVRTDVFMPMEKLELRQYLKLESDYIIGFVGRFTPEKGLLVLLAAMCRLPAKMWCILIGDGPMRTELELWSNLPDLKGRVQLLDPMLPEELVKYMNCIDALVLPSLTTRDWKEQYGRVLGEAMACGVPVIGSDSGAIPEVIGDAGLIVPEGNVSALVEAVQTAVFDEVVRARLVKNGLDRCQQELSVEAMSKHLLDFYGRILGIQIKR